MCQIVLTCQPVHPIHLCYVRRWSLRRVGMACTVSPQGWSSVNLASSTSNIHDCVFKLSQKQSNVHTTTSHIDHLVHHPNEPFLSSQRFTSIRGARVVLYDELGYLVSLAALALRTAMGISRSFFSFRASLYWASFRVSYVWPCNLVFKHGIKAGGRWKIKVASPKSISP